MSNSRTQYGDSRTVRDAIAEGNKMTVNLPYNGIIDEE